MTKIIRVSEILKDDNFDYNYFMKNLYSALQFLSKDYPGFKLWFLGKVESEIICGKRELIMATYKREITGIAILKDTEHEKKICTMRVFPKFENMGYGKALFEHSFEILKYDRPIISISESRLDRFEGILKFYDFELNQVSDNYYGNDQAEYVYNGELEQERNVLTKLARR